MEPNKIIGPLQSVPKSCGVGLDLKRNDKSHFDWPRGEMILSTHAIVGGAVASLCPSHPMLVAVLGFASHFAIDAIPHWDYPLQSISVKAGANNRKLKLNRQLFLDLFLIGFDACAGLALTLWLFATPENLVLIALGAIAGMSPDPLQFVHSLYPRQPLKLLQRFHVWIHSKQRLAWQLGASSQALFAVMVIGTVLGLH
jgi:hypothetical protein